MKQVLILLLLAAVVCGLPAPQHFDGNRDRFRGDGRPDWRWPDRFKDRPDWPDRFNDRPDWPNRHHHRPDWDRRPVFYPPGFFLGNVIGGLLTGGAGGGAVRPVGSAQAIGVGTASAGHGVATGTGVGIASSGPGAGSAQAVGIGTASVNNGVATGTGVGIANAPNGGIGFGLGIGGAISTPFGSTAFGSGQSIAVGRR